MNYIHRITLICVILQPIHDLRSMLSIYTAYFLHFRFKVGGNKFSSRCRAFLCFTQESTVFYNRMAT